MTKQAQNVSTLAKCEFRINSVKDVNLAGVELRNIKSVTDLSMGDAALILSGFASPIFPLSLTLIIDGKNPNSREAGLNRLEWILFIDDIQMTSGIMDKPIMIPAKSSLNIPVEVGLDLKKVLSGNSSAAMLNFCMNLAGAGNTPTRFKIKLKPSVMVSGKKITYPGYITVNTEYLSK